MGSDFFTIANAVVGLSIFCNSFIIIDFWICIL